MFFRVFFWGGNSHTDSPQFGSSHRLIGSTQKLWTLDRAAWRGHARLQPQPSLEHRTTQWQAAGQNAQQDFGQNGCYSCWNRKKKGVVNPEQRDMI